MDTPSQNVIAFLSGMAAASDRLHKFGYALYLQYHTPLSGSSWSSQRSRNIALSGSPFTIHDGEKVEQFDRLLGVSFWLEDAAKTRSITFAVDVAYRENAWFVQSNVEDDNGEHAELWCSEEYWAATLDEALCALDEATEALLRSATCPEVAAALQKIR